MNRRESIKNILLGSLAGGALLRSCTTVTPDQMADVIWQYQYGRTPQEKALDEKLLNTKYFSDAERELIRVVANLILPPNESGSIEQAAVVPFIEFMAKDIKEFAAPIREGLTWLDVQAKQKYGQIFVACNPEYQKQILDTIAFELPQKKEQPQEIKFFKLIRNLVVTGYFTSEVGIKELGYVGNTPNVWDGVPQDVLDEMGLAYDPEWLAKCVDQEKRNETARWDKKGNLLT